MFPRRFASSTGPIGIDFGTTGVRLIQLREHGGDLSVVGAARLAESTEAFDALSVDDAAQLIRRATQGMSGRRCLVALPRCDLHSQSVRLPTMNDGELRQAITWEAAQRFSLTKDQMECDFIRTGAVLQSQEGREEIIVVAAPHDAIMPRLEPILAAGLRPEAIEPSFIAMARFYSRRCRRESDRSIVRVITEIGASGSIVMILRGDQVAFVKPLATSGHDLDAAVMNRLQLDEAGTRDIRAARMAAAWNQTDDRGTASDRAVFEAVRPLLNDLVKEIVLCLRYYGVTFRGHPPDQIILAGGDGFEPQLAEMLREASQLPVEFDDAAGTIRRLEPLLAAQLHDNAGAVAGWAVAAGLSMRGLAAARVVDDSDTPNERRGAA